MVNWYDAPVGGNLILENSLFFTPAIQGTYYAEAISSAVACISDTRTAITVDFYEPPSLVDENLTFCKGSSIILSADIPNMTYEWNNGETTQLIEVDSPGTYSVKVTNANNCSTTKTITLTQLEVPIINTIISDAYSLKVILVNSGEFEYSIDGINYQSGNIFDNTPGGSYTIYVREANGCGTVPKDYFHLVIPKFFTPNGDMYNDVFAVEGIEAFINSEVHIFDRYGNLLKSTRNEPFTWDGDYNNNALPSSDYWYLIKLDSAIYRGQFSLKR